VQIVLFGIVIFVFSARPVDMNTVLFSSVMLGGV
jgi:hypothetical protein